MTQNNGAKTGELVREGEERVDAVAYYSVYVKVSTMAKKTISASTIITSNTTRTLGKIIMCAAL